jgi:hypothetical protein
MEISALVAPDVGTRGPYAPRSGDLRFDIRKVVHIIGLDFAELFSINLVLYRTYRPAS